MVKNILRVTNTLATCFLQKGAMSKQSLPCGSGDRNWDFDEPADYDDCRSPTGAGIETYEYDPISALPKVAPLRSKDRNSKWIE